MNERGDAGTVVFLEGILHPVRVARRVMEETPHVILSGEGPQAYARAERFEETDLLTRVSRDAWRRRLVEEGAAAPAGPENHDTLCMLALDVAGRLCGS